MKVSLGFPTEIQTHPINNTLKTSSYLITERRRKIQKMKENIQQKDASINEGKKPTRLGLPLVTHN